MVSWWTIPVPSVRLQGTLLSDLKVSPPAWCLPRLQGHSGNTTAISMVTGISTPAGRMESEMREREQGLPTPCLCAAPQDEPREAKNEGPTATQPHGEAGGLHLHS